MSTQRHVGFRKVNSDGKVETIWVEFEEMIQVAAEIVCRRLQAVGRLQRFDGDRGQSAESLRELLGTTIDVILAAEEELTGR